jgi:hypothetical protein
MSKHAKRPQAAGDEQARPDRLELHRRMKAITDAGLIGDLPAPALLVLIHVSVHGGFADCLVSIGARAIATLNRAHRTSIRRGIKALRKAGILKMRRRATHRRAAVFELTVPKAAAEQGTGCAPTGHTVCPPRAQGVPPQGTQCAPIHVSPVSHVSHEKQGRGLSGVAEGDTLGPPSDETQAARLRALRITPRQRAGAKARGTTRKQARA